MINYGKSVVPINNNIKESNFHSIELSDKSIAFFPLQINDKKNVEIKLNLDVKTPTKI